MALPRRGARRVPNVISSKSVSRAGAAVVVSTLIGIGAASAQAELLGLDAAIETIPLAEAWGFWTVNLYAVFSDPLDVIFNVYCRGASTTADRFVNVPAIGVAVWDAPLQAQVLIDPALGYDSFVTIGPWFGDINDTAVDPNFDVNAFENDGAICCDAGWYNSFPPNGQGTAGLYPGNRVLLARLTMPLYAGAAPASLEGSLRMTYNNGGVEIVQTPDLPFSAVAPIDAIDCNQNAILDFEEIAVDPSLDCNENSGLDECEIASGASSDANRDGVPDECQLIPGDLNGDGVVDGEDLGLALLGWGPCPAADSCGADLNGDGVINGADLGDMLLNWSG
jgi:hypothetical protein